MERADQEKQHDYKLYSRIDKEEDKEALRKMNVRKAIGTDCIPMEI